MRLPSLLNRGVRGAASMGARDEGSMGSVILRSLRCVGAIESCGMNLS